MKNHVFLMQVHKQPILVGRIVRKLEADNHYFIINIDAKCKCYEEFKDSLEGLKNVIFNKKVNVMHGGFSQVKCTVQQMELALKNNVNFDYFHTISGQCYPCVSNREFDDFFENNEKSYMMLDTEEEVTEWRKKKYSDRLEHFYFWDVFNKPWMKKIHLTGIAKLLLWNFPRKYSDMNELWGGWNWFSLHRGVVEYLLQYFQTNPEYVRRFHFTHCCDELIYSTVLIKQTERFHIEKRNSLRYIDWHPKRSYNGNLPLTLNELDYQNIIDSGALFCRKVEENESAKLMDLLDLR